MKALLLYAEGKYFSQRANVGLLSRRLHLYESEVAERGESSDHLIHMKMALIWKLVEDLCSALTGQNTVVSQA